MPFPIDLHTPVTGLDIGSSRVKAVIGLPTADHMLQILGVGEAASAGVTRGNITNIDKTIIAIHTAVQEAARQAGVKVQKVNVAVAGNQLETEVQHGSITREGGQEEIRLEDVRRLQTDMQRLVTSLDRKMLHAIPQEYFADSQESIQDPVGITGLRLGGNFMMVTATSHAINNVHKCISRAELMVDKLVANPIATSLSTLTSEEKEAGVCMVDIGAGTVHMSIYYGNILRYIAGYPIGGANITEDIRQGCMLMTSQAEHLKKRFGRAVMLEGQPESVEVPGIRHRPPKEVFLKNLSTIIEARMLEIVEWVYYEILSSGYHSKLAGGIVLTGGGAYLQLAEQLFEYITGYDTRVVPPHEQLAASSVRPDLSFATSIGLVLAGYQGIDYREQYYQQQKASPLTPPPPSDEQPVQKGFFRRLLDSI